MIIDSITVLTVLGSKAVLHSSGMMILTGSNGYIAGTIGAVAMTVAWLPTIGILAAGALGLSGVLAALAVAIS